MKKAVLMALALVAFGYAGTANAHDVLSFTADSRGSVRDDGERSLPLPYEARLRPFGGAVPEYLRSETGEGFILFAPVTEPGSQVTVRLWQIHTRWPETFRRPVGYKSGNAYGISVALRF